jgi:putative glutathione S-transferase
MKKRITEYKNIWGYVRELYSIPQFAKYTFFRDKAPSAPQKGPFKGYEERIAPLIPWEELWKTDGERKKLSKNHDDMFLRHPADETPEDYQSEISDTIWNSPSWEDRNPRSYKISVDPSINPIQGLL